MAAFVAPIPLPGRISSSLTVAMCPQVASGPRRMILNMSVSSEVAERQAASSESPTEKPVQPLMQLPDPIPSPPPLTTLGHQMKFKPKGFLRELATSYRLLRQVRGRIPNSTILYARVGGALPERSGPPRPFSSPELTLPSLTDGIRLAAHDPRIAHLHLRIDTLACGWAKVIELRRHIDYFRSSGKTVSAFMEVGGPKEFFLAMGYAVYVPPQGSLSLRGFTASGSFLRGVLDKIGVSPQVERIGKYKSAGDQLSRTDMSDAQREVLSALLADVNDLWTKSVAQATTLSEEAVGEIADRAPFKMQELVDAGMITGVCYESDLEDALKLRFCKRSMFGGDSDESILKRSLPKVDIARYAQRTSDRLLGLGGSKRIALIRAVGNITSGKNGGSALQSSSVGSDSLTELIRRVRDGKQYEGCILRLESPGGSALASDVLWRELQKLGEAKPFVATQGDVAASGGYYLSMAGEIVSEPLTITGSIGVVAVKPSLGEFYKKIGYSKENISVGGRFAELLVDDREFSEDELQYFKDGTKNAYETFVSKAADSRGKTFEEMDLVAQGRVWTGRQAIEQGLVDHVGGLWRAVELVKEKIGLSEDDFVHIEEVRAPMSFAERLGLGAAAMEVTVSPEEPLALSEVDGTMSGVSPISRMVLDMALAPLFRHLHIQPNRIADIMERLLRSVLSG